MTPVRSPVSVLVGAALCVGMVGCGADENDESHTSAVIDAPDPSASTVAIAVRGCGGGHRGGVGTVIDDAGLLVTAAHVVAGASSLELTAPGGVTSTAQIVYFDPQQDVAALRAEQVIGEPARLASSGATTGDHGLVVTPDRDDPAADPHITAVEVVRTVTIRTTDIYLDADVERHGFEIDAPVEPGDSGAMVHGEDGGIGIVWARSTTNEGRAWAVDIPDALADPAQRAELTTVVAAGPCP